jgi:hypothetical protein
MAPNGLLPVPMAATHAGMRAISLDFTPALSGMRTGECDA